MSGKIRQSFHELVQIVKNNLDKSSEHFHPPPTARSLTTTRPYSYFHRRMFSWNKYLRISYFISTALKRFNSFAWLYIAEPLTEPSRYIIRSEVYRLRPNVQKSVPNLKFIMWVVVWPQCLPQLATAAMHWDIILDYRIVNTSFSRAWLDINGHSLGLQKPSCKSLYST